MWKLLKKINFLFTLRKLKSFWLESQKIYIDKLQIIGAFKLIFYQKNYEDGHELYM